MTQLELGSLRDALETGLSASERYASLGIPPVEMTELRCVSDGWFSVFFHPAEVDYIFKRVYGWQGLCVIGGDEGIAISNI